MIGRWRAVFPSQQKPRRKLSPPPLPVTVAERFHFVHIQPKSGELDAKRRPISQSLPPPQFYVRRKPVWEDLETRD